MKCKFYSSLVLMAFFLGSCAQSTQKEESSTTLTATDFQKAIQQKGAQVLDVRTAGEFQSGHIAGALQADWSDAKEFEKRVQHLDKKATIYVYCQAGGRSAAAQTYLIEKGYQVVNLEGGMSNWKMNNLPVEGNDNTTQMRVADFDKVIASNALVLVDIGATWCPPCRKMLPIVEEVKKENKGKLYFLAVDGGVDMEVMQHVQFEELPTFIIYKNGKEVWRKTGIVSKDEFLQQLK